VRRLVGSIVGEVDDRLGGTNEAVGICTGCVNQDGRWKDGGSCKLPNIVLGCADVDEEAEADVLPVGVVCVERIAASEVENSNGEGIGEKLREGFTRAPPLADRGRPSNDDTNDGIPI